VIRPGALGDCIVSLPALEFLSVPSTEVWVSGPNVPLITFATRVRSIQATGLDLVPYQHVPVLRELEQFDEIVSWYATNRPEFREAVAHLPFTFHQALPSGHGLHAVDFYSQQVGAPFGTSPKIDLPRNPRGYLAIHPFSGGSKKNWPLDQKHLFDRLLSI
jgi:hypothetical protein